VAQRARFRAAMTVDARRSILGKLDALDIPLASEVESSPMLDVESSGITRWSISAG